MTPLPRWAVIAIGAALLIIAVVALTRCGAPSAARQAEQAVELDRSEAAAEGYERGLIAEPPQPIKWSAMRRSKPTGRN